MNYIDLRDVIENKKTDKDTYKAWKKAFGDDFEGQAENEPTMIPESEWDDYAWDCANAYLGIDLNKGNLSMYFDNEKWANDLRMDYNEVEVDGTTYLFRSY